MDLSKESSQILGSRLRERNLLAPGTTFYWYRERDREFRQYFTCDATSRLVFCCDIEGLITALGTTYVTDEWRLFIDSSTISLKAVLLHNGNRLRSVPVAHSVLMSESYESMKILLDSIQYEQHNWLVCGDLKVSREILNISLQ